MRTLRGVARQVGEPMLAVAVPRYSVSAGLLGQGSVRAVTATWICGLIRDRAADLHLVSVGAPDEAWGVTWRLCRPRVDQAVFGGAIRVGRGAAECPWKDSACWVGERLAGPRFAGLLAAFV
jgi:hypothetical protein